MTWTCQPRDLPVNAIAKRYCLWFHLCAYSSKSRSQSSKGLEDPYVESRAKAQYLELGKSDVRVKLNLPCFVRPKSHHDRPNSYVKKKVCLIFAALIMLWNRIGTAITCGTILRSPLEWRLHLVALVVVVMRSNRSSIPFANINSNLSPSLFWRRCYWSCTRSFNVTGLPV